MVAITSPLITKRKVHFSRAESLRQRLRTYGTRAPNDTPKCFHGTRHSLLSQLLWFLSCDQRFYIVKCTYICLYIYIYIQYIYLKFIAKKLLTACSRTSYKTVPLTKLNNYLHHDTSETEANININVNNGREKHCDFWLPNYSSIWFRRLYFLYMCVGWASV